MEQFQRAVKGPAPTAQEAIFRLLSDWFREKPTWPATEVNAWLSQNGFRDNKTIAKAKRKLGVRSYARFFRAGGFEAWYWTTEPYDPEEKWAD